MAHHSKFYSHLCYVDYEYVLYGTSSAQMFLYEHEKLMVPDFKRIMIPWYENIDVLVS